MGQPFPAPGAYPGGRAVDPGGPSIILLRTIRGKHSSYPVRSKVVELLSDPGAKTSDAPQTHDRVSGGGTLLSKTAVFSVVVLLLGLVPIGITAGTSPNRGPPELATRATAVPSVPPLTISSFTASPSEAIQGNPVFLNVTADGGAPPYSYWYQNLPIYCLSMNVSSLPCYPLYVGVFDIRVTVNDTLGGQADTRRPT